MSDRDISLLPSRRCHGYSAFTLINFHNILDFLFYHAYLVLKVIAFVYMRITLKACALAPPTATESAVSIDISKTP